MATALLARTVRAVINAHRGIDKRANVLHFIVPGTSVTPAVVDAVAADLVQWVNQFYKPLTTNQIVFDDITATDASVESGYQKVISLNQLQGQSNSQSLPGNVAAVVTLHTAQPGRSGRGRVFMFETGTDQLANGETFANGYVQLLQSAFDLLINPTNGDPGYSLAVGSRKGLCSFDCTGAVAHAYIGNQKDRLPGHRRHKKTRLVP